MSSSSQPYTFVDLFAGVGGFHAALSALGGKCVYAVEKDSQAAAVYDRNWRPLQSSFGDIVQDTEGRMRVPKHDVLAAGFPCQPFSKSGFQRGMDEARGTLFWNVCEVLRVRQPSVVLLENVRNIAGPRHAHEWGVIIRSLRNLGYRVSSIPVVFSPHLLPPERGGRPQVRERVFILGTWVGREAAEADVAPSLEHRPVDGWSPQDWSLREHVPVQSDKELSKWLRLNLTPAESTWVEAWNDFVVTLRRAGIQKLPGFPIWKDAWVRECDLVMQPETPAWKANFLRKNAAFYTQHEELLEGWLKRWEYLAAFPASRRKFEWQAQDSISLDETVIHLRPSGIRAKRATYAPALVAITQTSILGQPRRRFSPREAARLQGLPEWFDFGGQPAAATYKQMGNGVNAGAAYYVLREHILLKTNLSAVTKRAPHLAAAVLSSSDCPDEAIERHWDKGRPVIRRARLAESSVRVAG